MTTRLANKTPWQKVCRFDELLPGVGVCARVAGFQVALFRIADEVYAIGNYDPNSGAAVLSRGLVGDIEGRLVVASPIYKQHFDLVTGECLEAPSASVRCWEVRVVDGWVEVGHRGAVAARKPHLVVIGNGMAAMRVVEEVLRIAPDLYDITVFGAEPHATYNRIMLSSLLAGDKRIEDITLNSADWFDRHGIALHCGDAVVELDRPRRLARAASGYETRYDRLLLATGSHAVVIPVPGCDLDGVVTFRDLRDVNSMLMAANQHHRAVVIGGGLLGLEAANGLLRQGMTVTVVHLHDSLMERQLDRPAGAMLQASMEAQGVTFKMGAQTEAILGDVSVGAVRLKDGTDIAADLVVMAVGIRPNIDLAESAGLRCERGLLVDDTLQTYDPRIYAVGECVQHRNATYGLVAPLMEQAQVCAAHLAQLGYGRYQGSITATKLKVTGIDLFSAGDFTGDVDSEDLVLHDPARNIYKRLILHNQRIVGVVLFGDVSDSGWYFELMQQGVEVSALRSTLLFGRPDNSARKAAL